MEMTAYFAQWQGKTESLCVVVQDKPSFELLHNKKPKGIRHMIGDGYIVTFERSEKTITLLRLLGVYGELK